MKMNRLSLFFEAGINAKFRSSNDLAHVVFGSKKLFFLSIQSVFHKLPQVLFSVYAKTGLLKQTFRAASTNIVAFIFVTEVYDLRREKIYCPVVICIEAQCVKNC